MHYLQEKKRLSRGEILPVYILVGEETYLKEEFISFLESKTGSRRERLEGKELTLAEVLARAAGGSLFWPRRLLYVVDAPYFTGDRGEGDTKEALQNEERLRALLKETRSSAIILFSCTKGDNRRRIFKQLSKEGAVINFTPLKGASLKRWVRERLQDEGKTITAEALENLLLAVDQSLPLAGKELEKIFTYLGPGETEVTAAVTGDLLSRSASGNIFQLMDALGEGRSAEAFKILSAFKSQGTPPLYILFMIARHCRLLFRTLHLAEDLPPAQLAARLKVPPFVARKLSEQCRRWSSAGLEAALALLQETDYSIKTGVGEPFLALEILLSRLFSLIKS